MESIRSRLTKNFLAVIIVTIVIIDILMMIYLKRYYYDNTKKFLQNQIESSITFYNKYFSGYSLEENIYDDVDAFWQNTENRTEIMNISGALIMDSEGIRDNEILNTPDIKKAITEGEGIWTGKLDYYKGNVMIVSKTIISNGEKVGIMRIIYPLREVDSTLKSVAIILIILSFVVVAIGSIISFIRAKDISNPIKKVTEIAEEMAKGNLSVRSTVNNNKEIEKLSNILNFMASEINTREKLKNQFISSVSHELRTPLTAIKGWVLTLKDDINDQDTIKIGLEIIDDETDRLSKMVEELLDFSKILSGVVQINMEECDVDKFINSIGKLMMPRAANENKIFIIDIDKNIGKIKFDVNKIKQVLINVLDNAFKFTDEGGSIELSVFIEENFVNFIVEDDGCGISKEDMPRVKEKFYKGQNSKSQNGIGLSVCDEIIKLHRGSFYIHSQENKGTKVVIQIPAEKEENYEKHY